MVAPNAFPASLQPNLRGVSGQLYPACLFKEHKRTRRKRKRKRRMISTIMMNPSRFMEDMEDIRYPERQVIL